jgi:hypothetical protein
MVLPLVALLAELSPPTTGNTRSLNKVEVRKSCGLADFMMKEKPTARK